MSEDLRDVPSRGDVEPLRPVERVLARTFVTEAGCWQMTGHLCDGYGTIGIGSRTNASRRMVRAHRVVWEHFRGPIPPGLVLDHLCRNRACQRPDHMRVVTHRENIFAEGALGTAKINADKTHCKRGHAFDSANTYTRPDGRRECWQCKISTLKQARAAVRRGGKK